MNKLLQSLLRRHEPDIDALSAHVDGRLASQDAAALEAHMTSCDACRAAFAELGSVQAALRSMPEVEHPRSFRLRAADVERAPARASGGSTAMRLMPALSGLAAVLFVAVLAFDSSRGGGRSLAQKSANAPLPQAAAERNTTMMDDATAYYSARTFEAAASEAVRAGTPAEPPNAGAQAAATPGVLLGADAADAAPDVTPPAPGVTDSSIPLQTAQAAASRAQIVPSPTPELSAAVQRPTSDDDSDDALRAVEVIAATVAIAAAVGTAVWRLRRRGEGT